MSLRMRSTGWLTNTWSTNGAMMATARTGTSSMPATVSVSAAPSTTISAVVSCIKWVFETNPDTRKLLARSMRRIVSTQPSGVSLKGRFALTTNHNS